LEHGRADVIWIVIELIEHGLKGGTLIAGDGPQILVPNGESLRTSQGTNFDELLPWGSGT
jgi:hypothetical protein